MKQSPLLYRVVRAIVAGFCRLFWRLEVHGAEHIPPTGAFVIAPVHRSNIDFAVVAALTKRRMRYMAKDSLWKIKPLGKIWDVLGAFPVARGSAAARPAINAAVAVLAEGDPIVMFPEGARQSGPEVLPLFDGPALVASRAGVPVVPVGIGGSEQAMPKGSKILRPVKIHVVIGPAIPAPSAGEDGKRVPRRAVHELTERLSSELQTLFDDARRRAG